MFFFVLVFMAAVVAYLLKTPVPDGITDPRSYRRLMFGVRLIRFIVKCYDLVRPELPNDILILRYITKRFGPKITSKVKGSNFAAVETTFDGVKVRLYEPLVRDEKKLMTGFVYIHGGGYCLGSTALYEGLTRQFADILDTVVVSVGYRLSPKHVFPAQYDDCVKASRWFIANASKFNVNPVRIGIGGDSAGGTLAAMVAQNIHDDKILPDFRIQLLVYPSIQKIDTNVPSHQKYKRNFGSGGFLPRQQSARFLSYHIFGKIDQKLEQRYQENNHTSLEFKKAKLNKDRIAHQNIPRSFRHPSYYSAPNGYHTGDDAVWNQIKEVVLDPRFSPLNREDLTGLPTAYIITCGFDLIRDDGIFYAKALKQAGVNVTWKHYEEGFHGIFSPNIRFELGKQMRQEALEFIKGRL